jgi:hypothetical protein
VEGFSCILLHLNLLYSDSNGLAVLRCDAIVIVEDDVPVAGEWLYDGGVSNCNMNAAYHRSIP